MKKPGSRGRGRFHINSVAVLIGLTLFLLLSAGIAFGSGGGHEESGPKGWVNTDTFRVINFVVLAGALFFVLKKPVAQALSGRIESIRLQLEELEAKKIEAEKQLASANDALAKMDKEAEKIIAGYIQQGEDAKVRLIEQAKLAAEKLEAQAQRNIEHQFQQAKLKLQSEIIELALSKAEMVIKDGITDKDQDRLVEEYLDKVVA
jgi:F-type H+-transporting ATPase subunit b